MPPGEYTSRLLLLEYDAILVNVMSRRPNPVAKGSRHPPGIGLEVEWAMQGSGDRRRKLGTSRLTDAACLAP